jgi:hypothetical protein
MILRRPTRMLAATAVLAATAAASIGAAAPADTGHTAAAAKITRRGVDGVRLGMSFTELRAAGRVGKLRQGCELGGPSARSARLRSPLKGSVDFTPTSPRKAAVISVTGGATARGVGIGGTIPAIKAAYPKAKVDHSTESVFGITLVKIPKGGGGRLQFAVDTTTHKVTLIGIPVIAFCD